MLRKLLSYRIGVKRNLLDVAEMPFVPTIKHITNTAAFLFLIGEKSILFAYLFIGRNKSI